MLSWICIKLSHWNSPKVDTSLHINLILSQQVFAHFHLCCVLSGKAANTNVIVYGLTMVWPEQSSNTWSIALETCTLTITPPMRSVILWLSVLFIQETSVPDENKNLPQTTHKLYHSMVYRVHFAIRGNRIRIWGNYNDRYGLHI
jgi:hypothetical protein